MRQPRQPMDGVPPEFIKLMAAMYCPHFMREFLAWGCMRRQAADRLLPDWGWAGDAGYCLDRTEAL